MEFHERPCLKGIRWTVVEKYTRYPQVAWGLRIRKKGLDPQGGISPSHSCLPPFLPQHISFPYTYFTLCSYWSEFLLAQNLIMANFNKNCLQKGYQRLRFSRKPKVQNKTIKRNPPGYGDSSVGKGTCCVEHTLRSYFKSSALRSNARHGSNTSTVRGQRQKDCWGNLATNLALGSERYSALVKGYQVLFYGFSYALVCILKQVYIYPHTSQNCCI